MKKIILTAVVFMGITATAQVKIGTDPTNLATDANLQVEGTTTAEQFVVLKNGNVGIGTKTPVSQLAVSGPSASILIERFNNGPHFIFRNAGGTQAAPTATTNGTITGRTSAWSYDGATYLPTGYVDFLAAENQTATARGGDIAFFTTPLGSVSTSEKMRISANGNVSIITTPTITTATKVLVKEPVTNVISEQVMNGNSVSTTAVAAGTTIQAVVGGNTEHTTAGAGVIMVSPNGDKWKVSVGDGGVLTIVKAL